MPSVAIVRDFRAEGWPSMDLCADQLLAHWPPGAGVEDVATPFRRRVGRVPFAGGTGFNADRLLNRHVFLPRIVRLAAGRSDFVHIVDHSYAHLTRAVPPGRAGVYCHDLDAFRSLLEPAAEPRPLWFRRLAARTLDGLKRAAIVFHSTAEIRDRILRYKLVDAERLVHAPYGVSAEFAPLATGIESPTVVPRPYLLHVGSNIPRKRLDVLLDVFAVVREERPELKLVQVGGPWPAPLAQRIDRLGIGSAVTQLLGLTRPQLAELYRGAAAVLIPSDAEGFGLPVIEALACGATVIASDLAVLREVGGNACAYAPVGDVRAWATLVQSCLRRVISDADRIARSDSVRSYTWSNHAAIIASAYRNLACSGPLTTGFKK